MSDLELLWENMKRRSIRLQLADQTDEQTHINHALLTVVFFGGSGLLGGAVFFWALFDWWTSWVFTKPLAFGIVCGWIFYLIREVLQRAPVITARLKLWQWGDRPIHAAERMATAIEAGKPLNLWDGICDFVVPFSWTAPWALAALLVDVPAWTGILLYGSALLVLALYYVFRPIPEPA